MQDTPPGSVRADLVELVQSAPFRLRRRPGTQGQDPGSRSTDLLQSDAEIGKRLVGFDLRRRLQFSRSGKIALDGCGIEPSRSRHGNRGGPRLRMLGIEPIDQREEGTRRMRNHTAESPEARGTTRGTRRMVVPDDRRHFDGSTSGALLDQDPNRISLIEGQVRNDAEATFGKRNDPTAYVPTVSRDRNFTFEATGNSPSSLNSRHDDNLPRTHAGQSNRIARRDPPGRSDIDCAVF